MARVEQSMEINASPEAVFNYVADISKHSEWAQPGHKLTIEKTSDGPVGQGSTFSSVGHQFGENHDTVTIAEFVPNERVVYNADGSAGVIQHSFELSASGDGVELTKTFDPLSTKMPFTIFAPIAKLLSVPGTLRGDLERIKEKLEAS